MKIIYVAAHAVSLLLLFLTVSSSSEKTPSSDDNSEEIKNREYPPCKSCKVLVESFKKVRIASYRTKLRCFNKFFSFSGDRKNKSWEI